MGFKNLRNFERGKAFIAACYLFSLIPAYIVWNNIAAPLLIGFLFILLLSDIIQVGYAKRKVLPALLFVLVLILYTIRAGSNFWGFLSVICLFPIPFVRRTFLVDIYDNFVKVFAFIMALSLLLYFLVVFVGIDIPSKIIQPLNEAKKEIYYQYPFLITTNNFITGHSIRFFGCFDEPGVVGTISAIILLANKFDFRKWENVVVMLAGICSLSLSFFMVCGIYVIVIAPFKYKIISIILIIILINTFYSNELLYQVFFRRFEIDDGVLAGMNREHGNFANLYVNFRHSSDYWWGLGYGTGALYNEGGSSYKMLIVDFGLLFFVLYVSCYYLFAIGSISGFKKYFVYSLAFLGTMYQRPFINLPLYVFLMFSLIYVIERKYISTKFTNCNND